MPSSRGTNKDGRALLREIQAGRQIVIRQGWAKGEERPRVFAELVELDGEYEHIVLEASGIGPQAALEELARKLTA